MECLICFELVNQNNKYTTCTVCNMIVHTKCYKSWEKKSGNYKTCILCQQKKCLTKHNVTPSCLTYFSCFKQCFEPENYIMLPDK